MSRRSSLRTTTAMWSAMRYLARDIVAGGAYPHITMKRLVLYRFRLSKMLIEVCAYQAFDIVSGRSYPLAESPEEAAVYVVFPWTVVT